MQPLRDLMRSTLARSLRQLAAEDRLAAALPLVCGSALAGRCAVHRLSAEGVLHLHVHGAEWVQALGGMRERVRCDLERVAGVPVTGLHFHEAGSAPDRPPEPSPPARAQAVSGRQRSARPSTFAQRPRRPA